MKRLEKDPHAPVAMNVTPGGPAFKRRPDVAFANQYVHGRTRVVVLPNRMSGQVQTPAGPPSRLRLIP